MTALILLLLGVVIGGTVVGLYYRSRLSEARQGKLAADQDAAVARTQLEAERRASEQQIHQLNDATREKIALSKGSEEDRKNEIAAISSEVTKQAAESLEQLAKESRKADREATTGELKARTEEVKSAVEPIGEKLGDLETQVQGLNEERKKTEGAVNAMFETVTGAVSKLELETGQLVSALKRPSVRGTWGEMQLKNVVKAANMTERVDFHSQPTFEGDPEDGRLRPDMTVHLPSDRDLVVDSKVPLDAYLAANDATTDEERDRHLDRHAKQLKTHIDKLASKGYHAHLETPAEFVVCFLPNEAVYCAALDRDPTLLEHGAMKGVLIATPATLLALLYASSYGWREAAVEESAREVVETARQLHKRLGKSFELLDIFGRRFGSSVVAWDEAVGSIDSRLIPQLRRMEDAGADSGKRLKAPRPVDAAPRLLTSAREVEDVDKEDDGEDRGRAAA